MLKMSFFNMNTRMEMFVPPINCIIDDALLQAMPDIDQILLQFVDVMNFPGAQSRSLWEFWGVATKDSNHGNPQNMNYIK